MLAKRELWRTIHIYLECISKNQCVDKVNEFYTSGITNTLYTHITEKFTPFQWLQRSNVKWIKYTSVATICHILLFHPRGCISVWCIHTWKCITEVHGFNVLLVTYYICNYFNCRTLAFLKPVLKKSFVFWGKGRMGEKQNNDNWLLQET